MNVLHLDPKWHKFKKVRIFEGSEALSRPWRSASYLTVGMPLGVMPPVRSGNRCIVLWLGTCVKAQCSGGIGCPAETQAYECVRTVGSFPCTPATSTSFEKLLCTRSKTKSKQSLGLGLFATSWASEVLISSVCRTREQGSSTVLSHPSIRRVVTLLVWQGSSGSFCLWWDNPHRLPSHGSPDQHRGELCR